MLLILFYRMIRLLLLLYCMNGLDHAIEATTGHCRGSRQRKNVLAIISHFGVSQTWIFNFLLSPHGIALFAPWLPVAGAVPTVIRLQR